MSALVPFDQLQAMAAAVAKSGLFGMKSTEQALALMLVAQAEGQHPATITQDYDIIQGRAVRKTHSVLARFQAAGGRVDWHALTHEIADATFSHPQGGSLRISWTIEQARAIGLLHKDNWKNYPRAMLRARCIAEGVRAVYPAALGGMLVPEEAMDLPDNGPAAQPAPAQSAAPQPALPSPYPADRFEANMPRWRELVESGARTPEQIIALLESKATLSDDQRAQIMALASAPEQEIVEGEVAE